MYEIDKLTPRYIFSILLRAFCKCHEQIKSGDYDHDATYLEKIISTSKFTDLTYAIYSNKLNLDNVNKYESLYDTADNYHISPLSYAIYNENFSLALMLIESAVAISFQDKLIFEHVVANILIRKSDNKQIIIDSIHEDDKDEVSKFLDKHSKYFISGELALSNYPMKGYGASLNMYSYSVYGPTGFLTLGEGVKIYTKYCQEYANYLSASEGFLKAFFEIIAKSCEEYINICHFNGNIPSNSNFANDIIMQIEADKSRPHLVLGGSAGSAIALCFFEDKLIISNLGMGGDDGSAVQVFSISSPNNITVDFISKFVLGFVNATPANVIYKEILSIININPIKISKQNIGRVDNAVCESLRGIVAGLISLIDPKKVKEKETVVLDKFLLFMHKYIFRSLVKDIKNKNIENEKRITCCFIAIEFITRYYLSKNKEIIYMILILKNVIEYSGLGHFYIDAVPDEVKSTIQDYIIKSQEVAAVKTLDIELDMIAKGLI